MTARDIGRTFIDLLQRGIAARDEHERYIHAVRLSQGSVSHQQTLDSEARHCESIETEIGEFLLDLQGNNCL